MGRSDEDERTLFCANLSENVTEALLYELFLQAGPLDRVHIPRKDNRQCSFGFITYAHACTIPYAIALYAGTRLFDREISVRNRNANAGGNQQQQQSAVVHEAMDSTTALLRGLCGSVNAAATATVGGAFGFRGNVHHHDSGRQVAAQESSSNGAAGAENLTSTELEIQRLLMMSAQMLHGGAGAGGHGDYNTDDQSTSYRSRSQNRPRHRRFNDGSPPPPPPSYRSEHDNRFSHPPNRQTNSHQNYHHQSYNNHPYNDQRGGGDRQRDRSGQGRSSGGNGGGSSQHNEHRSRRRY